MEPGNAGRCPALWMLFGQASFSSRLFHASSTLVFLAHIAYGNWYPYRSISFFALSDFR